MRINLSSCSNAQDNEDFIDFEITSSTSSSSSSSSSHSREFEFQMSANAAVTEHLASSPADELFYKGKLLPLHLPPRLQMVQNLLESSVNFEEKTESPFDTCNNTPTSSCRVSGELSSEDLFFECPNEMLTNTTTTSSTYSSSIDEISSNSWSKKIKLMKQSSLSLTIKASKVLFKSLFTKTEHVAQDNEDNNGGGVGVVSKTMDYINKYMKFTKKNPFPFGKIPQQQQQQQRSSDRNQVDAAEKEKIIEEISSNRRSFSLSIKKQSSSKSSSTSSSSSASSSLSSSSSASSSLSTVNSNGVDELRRSSSAKSEIESSIEGAIAYCKQSHANEKVTEVGFGSFSCENQERSVLCKG